MYSFSYLKLVCCFVFSSNYCFLTCIEVSQEAGQVFWYSHLFLHGTGTAERRYPTSKVRSSGREEIPQVQGKRNPSKMVGAERGHQRADRLKPQSEKTNLPDHMDHTMDHSLV